MKKFDFVALGDITTDAFIRIKDADIHCNLDRDGCELCVRFGDKIPYEFVEVVRAVGNSPNAAVSATRLGLRSAIVTNIGGDQNGKDCLETLKKNGVAIDFVKTHKEKLTNYHYVLWYEAERTILIKHEEYDYTMPDIGEEGWIYLSSLGENSLPFHHEIVQYVKDRPNIKLAFQPGTFQIKLGYDALRDMYEIAELFFCNLQEAQRILETGEKDMVKLLTMMHERGPKIVSITDGPNGAYAYNGKNAWKMPMYPDPKMPYDRTGAGDSYSSTFTVAIARGKTIPEALTWGPVNSMSVVQYIGAQKGLLTQEKLEEYIKKAPDYYKPEQIL